MNADELDPAAVSHDERQKEPLLMEHATLSWDKVGKPTLRNIDLKESSLSDVRFALMRGPFTSAKIWGICCF